MCYKYYKCNWCGKRKESVKKIKIWCKWYELGICDDCYNNKLNNKGEKYPKYR